jgi:hypothetical protein
MHSGGLAAKAKTGELRNAWEQVAALQVFEAGRWDFH